MPNVVNLLARVPGWGPIWNGLTSERVGNLPRSEIHSVAGNIKSHSLPAPSYPLDKCDEEERALHLVLKWVEIAADRYHFQWSQNGNWTPAEIMFSDIRYCNQSSKFTRSENNYIICKCDSSLSCGCVFGPLVRWEQEFSLLELASATVTIQPTRTSLVGLVRTRPGCQEGNTNGSPWRFCHSTVCQGPGRDNTECSPAAFTAWEWGTEFEHTKFTIDNARRPNEFPNINMVNKNNCIPSATFESMIIMKRHKLEGRNFCLRVPVTPVTKM